MGDPAGVVRAGAGACAGAWAGVFCWGCCGAAGAVPAVVVVLDSLIIV